MSDALWYLGRGTGVVSLVLLTLVVALGIATRSGRPLPGLPRFAVTAVHRSASLLAVVFLLVHVVTLLFDPYAQLDVLALVVPFTAAAEPFWYGLGASALDLVLALVATSLVRHRIGPRIWRGIHWAAYAAWPIALAHGLGSGTDAGTGWMLAATGVCVAAVLAALVWRVRLAEESTPVAVAPAPEDRSCAVTTPTALSDLLDTRPGPVPWRGGPGPLIGELEAAGLTGRGGAGFPVARKLAAVVATGRAPVVVGNGAEGEPASRKDLALLTRSPHLVLDGLQLAAEAVGADRAYLYVAPAALATVSGAQRGRADRVPVDVVTAAEHFVSGEETAVVAALEGRPALPGDKFRRVVEHGVGGRPTAVQNVETLAHMALIGRHGVEWFRSRGTPSEPGTALVTISGAVNHPGVVEVELGTPLPEVLARAALRHPAPVLVGGFHGAWLAPAEVERAALSRASLDEFGASPGAGVLIALPAGSSGMAETARITGYLAGQSARQCGPCRNGLPVMAELLRRVAAGDGGPVPELHRLAGITAGRGACHHPDGTVRLVRSALRVFGGSS